jgi:hypothetical protein
VATVVAGPHPLLRNLRPAVPGVQLSHVTISVDFVRGRHFDPMLNDLRIVADVEKVGARGYRATFDLHPDGRGFGTLANLLDRVAGKRSTAVTVDGSREMSVLVQAMARCARPFAYSAGRCGFEFFGAVPARCRACPLYDEERAMTMIAATRDDRIGSPGDANVP